MTTEQRSIIRVDVVYALPDRYWSASVELQKTATVADALAAACLQQQVPGLVIDPDRLAIFSRSVRLNAPLRDGDRIEILRPLLVDPKQGRRERAGKSAKR